MKDKLIQLLESFQYPVYLQGTLSGSYPESFFTFWNNNSYDNNHYDNDAVSFTWSFDVNFYSTSPALVNTVILAAKALLREHGFIIGGQGYDLVSDEITHTGRGITVLVIENNLQEE